MWHEKNIFKVFNKKNHVSTFCVTADSFNYFLFTLEGTGIETANAGQWGRYAWKILIYFYITQPISQLYPTVTLLYQFLAAFLWITLNTKFLHVSVKH